VATFPPGFLEELKARAPVSEIVGRRVKLIRRGREFVGLSPFNAEKTPSFTVNDAKGFYHCFSSGEHGDVFSFLMKTEGLSFPEAVERVAEFAGMEPPKATPEDRRRAEQAKGLRDAVEIAAQFFETQLRMPAGRAAMDYLTGRGLGDAAMRRFRLGYAPADRMAVLAALRREGVSDDLAIEAGLARRGEDGSVYGYFRDRAIFTISDAQGRAIGFGARALGDVQPKYLNSPDGPLFHKGETLYGLDLAREPAHKAGEIIVVEGYMDAIALSEAGFPNVVAPLGTAITEAQIKRLWRIARTPTLCLDGDAAGRRAAGRAALRALPILEAGRSLSFAMLEGGKDPDDLVRTEGAGALRAALDGAESLVDVVWADALSEIDPARPEERAALDKRLHGLAREIQDETVARYVRDAFRERLRRAFAPAAGAAPAGGLGYPARRPATGRVLRRPGQSAAVVVRSLGEARVLFACCERPEVAEGFAERLALLKLADPEFDRLREALVALFMTGEAIDAAAIRGNLGAMGYDPALGRMETAVVRRGRPPALSGDAADAAEWLNQSIEAIERSDSQRSILERARSVEDGDDGAMAAVDREAIARAQGRDGGRSR